MKPTKQHVTAEEILAQHREAARQRAKVYRQRKRQRHQSPVSGDHAGGGAKRAANQSARDVTQAGDDPLAAARRFAAEIEARRRGG